PAAARARATAVLQRPRALRALLVPLLCRAPRGHARATTEAGSGRAGRPRRDRDRRRGPSLARARRPRGPGRSRLRRRPRLVPAGDRRGARRDRLLRPVVLRLRARPADLGAPRRRSGAPLRVRARRRPPARAARRPPPRRRARPRADPGRVHVRRLPRPRRRLRRPAPSGCAVRGGAGAQRRRLSGSTSTVVTLQLSTARQTTVSTGSRATYAVAKRIGPPEVTIAISSAGGRWSSSSRKAATRLYTSRMLSPPG